MAFLLEHPRAGLVLVDTGLHASIARGSTRVRARNVGWIGLALARHIRMRPEQAVAAQLHALGIDPAEVRLLVMTHLHFDHASALSDFPSATVLLVAREWHAAHARTAPFAGYCAAQLDPRPRYRTLDFDSPPAVASGPFERTLDLFGDSSLLLIDTPGHSHGHLSLLLRLSDRHALLTADAAYTLGTLREGRRPWRSEDPPAFEHSLRQLQAYERQNPDALIVPGHDMGAWEGLEGVYR